MSKRSWLSRLLGQKAEVGSDYDAKYRKQRDRGVEELAAGHYKKALSCFERGLEIDPRDGDLWFDRSFLLRILNLIHTD